MPAWNTREKRHGIVRFRLPSFDCEQIERDSFIRDFDAQRYHHQIERDSFIRDFDAQRYHLYTTKDLS